MEAISRSAILDPRLEGAMLSSLRTSIEFKNQDLQTAIERFERRRIERRRYLLPGLLQKACSPHDEIVEAKRICRLHKGGGLGGPSLSRVWIRLFPIQTHIPISLYQITTSTIYGKIFSS